MRHSKALRSPFARNCPSGVQGSCKNAAIVGHHTNRSYGATHIIIGIIQAELYFPHYSCQLHVLLHNFTVKYTKSMACIVILCVQRSTFVHIPESKPLSGYISGDAYQGVIRIRVASDGKHQQFILTVAQSLRLNLRDISVVKAPDVRHRIAVRIHYIMFKTIISCRTAYRTNNSASCISSAAGITRIFRLMQAERSLRGSCALSGQHLFLTTCTKHNRQ